MISQRCGFKLNSTQVYLIDVNKNMDTCFLITKTTEADNSFKITVE